MKNLDVNDYGFAHFTLILLLHYLVKCRSHSLAVYNNKFILGIGSVTVSRWCLLQTMNSLRQLEGCSSRRFLKEFLQKN